MRVAAMIHYFSGGYSAMDLPFPKNQVEVESHQQIRRVLHRPAELAPFTGTELGR
jgi:hypothetical protein